MAGEYKGVSPLLQLKCSKCETIYPGNFDGMNCDQPGCGGILVEKRNVATRIEPGIINQKKKQKETDLKKPFSY
jgi:hypothetical protein